MKAIETRYNGHRFRSRTEARWAVFLDALNVKYEYESEGYELRDGQRYLPDFYLPNEACFVEIKGAEPTVEEWIKAGELAFSTQKFVNVLIGQPGRHQVRVIRPSKRVSDPALAWLDLAPEPDLLRLVLYEMKRRGYAVDDGIPRPSYEAAYASRRYSVSEPTKVHYEIDFDDATGRLAIWRAYLMVRSGSEVFDERYGLFGFTEHLETVCSFRPMDPSGGSYEHARIASEIRWSPATYEAITRAKAARFEFGETPEAPRAAVSPLPAGFWANEGEES